MELNNNNNSTDNNNNNMRVNTLISILRSKGLNVFNPLEELPKGGNINKRILGGLNNTKCMIVIVTKKYGLNLQKDEKGMDA